MKFRTFVCSSLISPVASLTPAAHAQTAPATRRVSVKVQSVNLTNDSSVSSEHLQLIEKQILMTRCWRPAGSTGGDAQAGQRRLFESAGGSNRNGCAERDRCIAHCRRHAADSRRRAVSAEADYLRKNTPFPEAQLRQAFPIKDGEIASNDKIREGERVLRNLYATTGYMQSKPDVSASLDDEARTLSVHVSMQAGPQFTVDGLTLEGKEELARR
jgi:hypothetical protein